MAVGLRHRGADGGSSRLEKALGGRGGEAAGGGGGEALGWGGGGGGGGGGGAGMRGGGGGRPSQAEAWGWRVLSSLRQSQANV